MFIEHYSLDDIPTKREELAAANPEYNSALGILRQIKRGIH